MAPKTQASLVAMNKCAPLVIALVTETKPNYIYVGHSLTTFEQSQTNQFMGALHRTLSHEVPKKYQGTIGRMPNSQQTIITPHKTTI